MYLLIYIPLEIWLQIASTSPEAWRLFTQAIPMLGRYSLRPEVQIRMKNKFVKKFTEYETKYDGGGTYDYHKIVKWLLPNRTIYREKKSAWIEYYSSSNGGKKEYEEWYTSGSDLNHRGEDKPAYISYYSESGKIEEEIWYKEGNYHRDGDKPYAIQYYPSGEKRRETWCLPNKYIIDYDYNGKKNRERWFSSKNYKLHREGDLPAMIEYSYRDDVIKTESWFKNGELHRDNKKPIIVRYLLLDDGSWTEM